MCLPPAVMVVVITKPIVNFISQPPEGQFLSPGIAEDGGGTA
jgi:hypothetical protein